VSKPIPYFLVLGMSAWRQISTAKISEYKEERVEIFQRSVLKNTTRTLYGEKPFNLEESNCFEKVT